MKDRYLLQDQKAVRNNGPGHKDTQIKELSAQDRDSISDESVVSLDCGSSAIMGKLTEMT